MTTPSPTSVSAAPPSGGFSIRRLRVLILVALVAGVAVFTGIMYSLTQDLSKRFGPQVRADLEWRVQRGAQELSRAVDLGLAVSDAEMVEEAFGAYARSRDVLAIVAVDAEGKPVAVHGALPEATSALLGGAPGTIRTTARYLVSWAPVQIEGSEVGKVAVVVSTERMSSASALLGRATLITLVGGIAALVLGFVVITFFTGAVAQRDLQLSDYAHNLERKVDERTAQLDERNRGMRLVLDNVVQGFVTIDLAGVMASERSAVFDRWFGAPAAGVGLGDHLRGRAGDYPAWLAIGLDDLAAGFMPAELVLAQLPRRFTVGDATYDVAYTPIAGADGAVERLLVIIADVTGRLAHERAEREQRSAVALFQRIASDRASVEEFAAEAGALVTALRAEADPVVQKRLVHTLKGGAAIFGQDDVAAICGAIESELAERGGGLDDAQRAELDGSWGVLRGRLGQLLGEPRDVVTIEGDELRALVGRARAGARPDELADVIDAWQLEPVARRFERLGRQAGYVASRLGKPALDLRIDGGGVRLDAALWAPVWAAMVHVVRNAVDHGIEPVSERLTRGKPAAGALVMTAEASGGLLVFEIGDDGRGVDWARVREKAARLELPHARQEDLVEALFADGFSTRDEASETSGRGVGLSALRQAVQALGGTIGVVSRPGNGTCFRFTFPAAAAAQQLSRTARLRRAALAVV